MMIDSVNSLAEVLSVLTSAGRSGERDTDDPAFMQVLEQVLETVGTPAVTGSAAQTTLQDAIAAASQLALQAGGLSERISSALGNATSSLEDAGMTSKEAQEDSEDTIETLLALLSAAGLQVQPWHIQARDAEPLADAGGSETHAKAVSCIPGIAGAATVSPHDRLVQLQPALTGQSVATGLRENGLLTQSRPEVQEAPNAAPAGPAADTTAAAVTGTQSGTSETARSLMQQTISGKDADTIHYGKAAPPDVQLLEKRITDHGAALRATVTAARPPAGPDVQKAPPTPNITAAMATDGPARPGQDISGRTDEKHAGPATIADNGLRITASASSESRPASHDGAPKQETAWAAGPVLGTGNHQPATAGRALPDAAAQAGPSSALLSSSVVEQIAQRAHLLFRNGRAGVDIQLEPEELGKVRIHVGIGSEGLQVKLAAEAIDTRGILQAALPQLRQALENQGLRVDRFDLALGSGASPFGTSRDNSQQQPRLSGGSAQWQYAWEESTSPESAGSTEALAPSSLVDYRI